MTNEQFEKQMAFIVGQQARFEVNIQLLQQAQAKTEQVVARNAEAIERTSQVAELATKAVVHTADAVGRLADVSARFIEATHEGFKDTDGKINVLIDSQMRSDDTMKELAASQKLTDEAVRNLATTVDRHLRKGRNGQNN